MAVSASRDAGWRRAMAGMVLALMAGGMIAAGMTAAGAATLIEADLPGGEFSADYRAPTRVPAGIDRIRGTGGIGSDDYLLFDLPAGAQSIVLDFRAPEGIGSSYSAGGVVLFDTEAFAYEWAGTQLPVPIRLDHQRRRQSMTISLPQSFGGRLYLALNFTHGEDIAYSLWIPAKVPVLPVLTMPVLTIPVLTTVEAPAPSLVLLAPHRPAAAHAETHAGPAPASGLLVGAVLAGAGLLLWSRS